MTVSQAAKSGTTVYSIHIYVEPLHQLYTRNTNWFVSYDSLLSLRDISIVFNFNIRVFLTSWEDVHSEL